MTTERKPRAPRIKEERRTSQDELLTIEAYVERGVPEKHKIATRRALLGQITRSTAIRVKCLQCVNYQREEIKLCGIVTCALHPVRPYQDKEPLPDADDEV